MREIAFAKYEGLGNDFILVEAAREDALTADTVSRLCDRRRGIGADGVLLVLPPRDPSNAARLKIVNADGSVPEMCGNGLRCVVVHLASTLPTKTPQVLRVETDAGLRTSTIDASGMVTVEMGRVSVHGERSVSVDGGTRTVVVVDVGNPHAVLFGDATLQEVERLGPAIATHPSFPQGTNVEFARQRGEGIDLVVWERGVGLTQACGTGACATAAVACALHGYPYGAAIPVRLPGGTLEVTIGEDGEAVMKGPARRVFVGRVEV